MRAFRNLVLLLIVAFVIFLVGGGTSLWRSKAKERTPDPGNENTTSEPAAGGTGVSAEELDRRLGTLSQIRQALEQGHVGRAQSLLDKADAVPNEIRDQWETVRQSCANSLATALAALEKHVKSGKALQARDMVKQLIEPPTAAVLKPLRSLFTKHGWPSFEDGQLPKKDALSATTGRRVRVKQKLDWVEATVHEASGEQCTLRIQDTDGVRFPVVDRLKLEFVEPQAKDAEEQAALAASRNEVLLARLWLACRASLMAK